MMWLPHGFRLVKSVRVRGLTSTDVGDTSTKQANIIRKWSLKTSRDKRITSLHNRCVVHTCNAEPAIWNWPLGAKCSETSPFKLLAWKLVGRLVLAIVQFEMSATRQSKKLLLRDHAEYFVFLFSTSWYNRLQNWTTWSGSFKGQRDLRQCLV